MANGLPYPEHMYSTPTPSRQKPTSLFPEPDSAHPPERVTVQIVKGSRGFGFALGECEAGHMVARIMDPTLCSQLQKGDILLEFNQENVRSYSCSRLHNLLRHYARGVKATFVVHRRPAKSLAQAVTTQPAESWSRRKSHTPGVSSTNGKFINKEVYLVAQDSGFGFRIIGGAEVDSMPTVGVVRTGGAADGHLKVGDEIVRVNSKNVTHAYHSDVVDLVKKAGVQGAVVLDIRRKMTFEEISSFYGSKLHSFSEHVPSTHKLPQSDFSQASKLGSQSASAKFSPVKRKGIEFSPLAHQKGSQSSLHDSESSLVSHKSSNSSLAENFPLTRRSQSSAPEPECPPVTYKSSLSVTDTSTTRQKKISDDSGYFPDSHRNSRSSFDSSVPHKPILLGSRNVTLTKRDTEVNFGFAFQPKMYFKGGIISYIQPDSPAYDHLFLGDELLMVNGRNVAEMRISDILSLVKNSQTTINLAVDHQDSEKKTEFEDEDTKEFGFSISSDGKEVHTVCLRCGRKGFGFTIRGGVDYGFPISIQKIARGGSADMDGRLKVSDELLEINGNSTVNMLHESARTLIKRDLDIKLVVQREPTDQDEVNLAHQILYDEAMKAGFVTVKTSNVLLFGMAGTGKTSTKHLIFGLPPPEKRNSTPLAEPSQKVLVRKIRNLSGIKAKVTNNCWKPVEFSDLKQLLADIIQNCTQNTSRSPEPISEEMTLKMKPLQSSSQKHPEVKPSAEPAPVSEKAKKNHKKSTSMFVGFTESRNDKPPVSSDAAFLSQVSSVIAEIKSIIPLKPSGKEVSDSNWIYFIDSGGQPHFYNLLPLFIQGISAALYVLRLSDRLEDHPLVEYYKNDRPVGEPFQSHLSTEDNFKYLVQSIQSCNKDCNLVCIGTHLDRMDSCSESVKEKNSKLLKALPESIRDRCYFTNFHDNRFIMPINSQVQGDARTNTADKIRSAIQECHSKEIQVPVWWYALEIIIEEISNIEECGVISLDKCRTIANKLNFHEDALIEALKFFHKHHIFHYYPEILPGIVFCDTQVLLDKVTELVEHAAYLRDGSKLASGLGSNKFQFRDRGVITLKCLKKFRKHYVEGLFGPAELIEVFKHLLIATPLRTSTEEYFMPSLLGICSAEDIHVLRTYLLDKLRSTPLFVQFKNGWPRLGVFCCLQVYLIKNFNWSLAMHSRLSKPKQNVARFCLPNHPGFVTLIDSLTYIEIYVESDISDDSIFSDVRCKVVSGIKYACKALHYDNEEHELAFLCPHSDSTFSIATADSLHPAVALANGQWMKCTQIDKWHQLTVIQKAWLAGLDSDASTDSPDIDLSKVYPTIVQCGPKLANAISRDPCNLALKLLSKKLISQSVLDETLELSETKNVKGNRLYQVLLNLVKEFPAKITDLVHVLNTDKDLYDDILSELDKLFIVETML